jgi:hypothetical protein
MEPSFIERFWRSFWFVVKRTLIGSGFLLSVPFALLGLLYISQFPPIYYADYNTIRARIEKIPYVEIINVWMNENISLEDFSFTLQKPSCPPVALTFHQLHGARWRYNFQSIDGVILFKTGDKQREKKQLSRQELLDANLPINNLNDVIEHLEPLLAYLDSQAPIEDEGGIQGADAAYAHLTYAGGVCSDTATHTADLNP